MTKREFERLTRQIDVLQGLGFTRDEADKLRRISMTLHRWHELECGTEYGCIERGWITDANKVFVSDENGRPYMADHRGDKTRYYPIPDRETGARKRLAAIIRARNIRQPKMESPLMDFYIQTDPRGAALYIIRPGDVPEGGDVGAYYSRGICVY